MDCGGSEFTPHYEATWRMMSFWCEGILTCIVGGIGFIGNIFTITILFTKEMRRMTFNHLLIALAIYDLLFIICAVPIHAIPNIGVKWLVKVTQTSHLYGMIYQFFLYPFTMVSYCGSVYMTVAITVERYYAVCHPLRYRELVAETTPFHRALYYITPVVVCSLIFNIPKFLEIKVILNNGTLDYQFTDLRMEENFMWWYLHYYYIFHPFLTTTIGPIFMLCFLNYKVYQGIRQSRVNVSTSNSHGEINLALTFVTVCSIFIITHILRIVLAIELVIRASQMTECVSAHGNYVPPLPLVCMESISHILIMTNSSCNFIIYFTLSTQFKVFMKKLFSKRIDQSTINDSSMVNHRASFNITRLPLIENIELRPLQPRLALAVTSPDEETKIYKSVLKERLSRDDERGYGMIVNGNEEGDEVMRPRSKSLQMSTALNWSMAKMAATFSFDGLGKLQHGIRIQNQIVRGQHLKHHGSSAATEESDVVSI